jgi:outer membrane protein insertion porin family
VIRDRITVLPGDVYSEDRLIRSYQAISSLGYFETPLPQPGIFPDPETGDVDVVFHVVEKRTGEVNFGTTMGGYGGLAGFVGYSQPNLFGQGKSGSLRWDFGRYQNNFTASYTDPSLFQSRISGTVSLFNSRDRFFTFASGDRRLRGGSLRFGIPFPGSYYSRIIVGYSLSRTVYRLRSGVDDTSLFGRPAGLQSQASIGVARQTLDHPLFPTTGSEQNWTVQFNGGVLGGDANFVKHRITGTWWIPVARIGGSAPDSRPIITSLGLKTRFGAVFGNADRFPFDRFWLGGVQFGEPLRGYGETSITPLGYYGQESGEITDVQRLGDVFFALTAEYAIRISDAISISAFLDAGNIWRTPGEIDPSRLRRGAGIGGTVVTPFGPLGLDLAFGFDRPDRKWEFHFTMGSQGF